MKQRIEAFDLARSYAIFGMFIVNFTFCFGTFTSNSYLPNFQFLFIGNATSIFIILAGIGLSIMSQQAKSKIEKKQIKKKVIIRSWFLVAMGLLLYTWWPGDILHYYGGYMHIAAFILFIPKRYYLWLAFITLIIYHTLLYIIPVGTGWNYTTSEYLDFWTPLGFLRNTLYNGWNSIFPWIAFFLFGMWLGYLNWQDKTVQRKLFFSALITLIIFKGLKIAASHNFFSASVNNYMLTEYSPVVFPFIVITTCCAIIAILTCQFITTKLSGTKIIKYLIITGKMSLTLYIFHITLGMIFLSHLTKKKYTGYYTTEEPSSSFYMVSYALLFYIISVFLCVQWSKHFPKGPIETIMRKISK